MPNLKKKKKNRVCVIGLDGVPYDLLLDFARRDVLPTIGRIIDGGHLHKMKASLPEVSAVSWTDFMTGANAGTHGIFGFTDFKPRTYNLRFPNSLDVQAPSIWERLSGDGLTSVVINQPSTYPARPLNGVLISGFVAVDLAQAVYPKTHLAALEQMGYLVDIDTQKARDNPGELWQELVKTLMGRQKALNMFWEEPWDYFELVLTGTDRLHHFLWDAYVDPGHPQHQIFLEYYRQIDRLINKIYGAFRKTAGDEEHIFLLSDHGFASASQEVYLNAWLEKARYLKYAKPQPASLADIAPGKTVAFALDPNRIYLNTRGRFSGGIVYAHEAPALRQEIARKLAALEFEGRKVVRRVFFGKDIYSGPLAAQGPDLVVLAEPGFDMKASVHKKEIFGRGRFQGMHTWDDAFFLAKNDHGPELKISDLAGIILDGF